MPARVSKFWGGVNPNIKIDKFDKNILDKNNLVNMIVLLKQEDITRSLVMDLFGSFNGESLCHHYDTFEVPAGAFTFTFFPLYLSIFSLVNSSNEPSFLII